MEKDKECGDFRATAKKDIDALGSSLERSESKSPQCQVHQDKFLDRLSKAEIFDKKPKKIKQNPVRQKHLSGGENCYREPITKNMRLIYALEGNNTWFLTIGKHDEAYEEYRQRLRSLRERLS